MAMAMKLASAGALLLVLAPCGVHGAQEPTAALAQQRWARSPHGKMLERILPFTVTAAELPEPGSEGARLVARYCVQCHHLPNPPMHTAARWQSVVDRMVWRMRGEGNLGALMKDMMAEVRAPNTDEVSVLTAYLQQHGQREMDPAHPALRTEAGEIYSIACTQCHALPDPRRHTAREWPRVVERMRGYMAWANTVTGESRLRTTPELKTSQIVQLLQRYARPAGAAP